MKTTNMRANMDCLISVAPSAWAPQVYSTLPSTVAPGVQLPNKEVCLVRDGLAWSIHRCPPSLRCEWRVKPRAQANQQPTAEATGRRYTGMRRYNYICNYIHTQYTIHILTQYIIYIHNTIHNTHACVQVHSIFIQQRLPPLTLARVGSLKMQTKKQKDRLFLQDAEVDRYGGGQVVVELEIQGL